MHATAEIEVMWAACSDAFKSLELDHATPRLNGHEGAEPLVWVWSNEPAQQAHAQAGPPPGGDDDEAGDQSIQLDIHVVRLGIRNNGNLWAAKKAR